MSKSKLTFEAALKKLEEIVKKLEEGNLSLEDSLRIFEEGMALSQFCEKSLEEAQGKVEQLMTNSLGERVSLPFPLSDSSN